ncbi:MAG: sulfurtransferase [Pseudorhodobacter sp.]|nr:MAG: sulfurtransferase [Pseudorhodobacter sp.]
MFNIFGGSAAKRFTAADAVAMAAKGEITLLDVREAGEIAASGTAKGGVHIPLSMVPLKANPQGPDHDKRLDPTKPVAVFCAVGGRAGMATQALERMGYTAHNIGGFGDWVSAGGPVQR